MLDWGAGDGGTGDVAWEVAVRVRAEHCKSRTLDFRRHKHERAIKPKRRRGLISIVQILEMHRNFERLEAVCIIECSVLQIKNLVRLIMVSALWLHFLTCLLVEDILLLKKQSYR